MAGGETSGGAASGGAASGGEASRGVAGDAASSAGEGGREASDGDSGNAGGGAAPNSAGFTCADDIEITNEAELAEFAALNCVVLGGDLVIQSSSIRTLDALTGSGLRVIGGSLEIVNNTVLEDASGLRGLERIEESLGIITNGALTGLEGLENVERIGDDPTFHGIGMINNPVLASIEALGAAAASPLELHTNVMINGNPVLGSLRGLNGLELTDSLNIINNASLTEIGGLNDLEEAHGVDVIQNPALETCDFPSLQTAGHFTVARNDALKSISLPLLAHVSNTMSLDWNPALEDVGSLDQLMSVGTLMIFENPALPQCFVDALGARLMTCGVCSPNDLSATCD